MNQLPTSNIRMTTDHESMISGMINFDNVECLLATAKDYLNRHTPLTLNFAEVIDANSAGLIFLIALLRYAKQNNKKINFTHLPEKLLAAAKVSELEKILTSTTLQ